MKTLLSINGFELPVHLGWPEAERQQPQTVRIDLTIQFVEPPKACETDQLEDTFCYDELLEKLRAEIADRPFRLLEHLTNEIYKIIKPALPTDAKLTVNTLKYPPISGLTGGVSFFCAT